MRMSFYIFLVAFCLGLSSNQASAVILDMRDKSDKKLLTEDLEVPNNLIPSSATGYDTATGTFYNKSDKAVSKISNSGDNWVRETVNSNDVITRETFDSSGAKFGETERINPKKLEQQAINQAAFSGVVDLDKSNTQRLINKEGVPRSLIPGAAKSYDVSSGTFLNEKGEAISQISKGYSSETGENVWYRTTTNTSTGVQTTQGFNESGKQVGNTERVNLKNLANQQERAAAFNGTVELNADNTKYLVQNNGFPRGLIPKNAKSYDTSSGTFFDEKGKPIVQISKGYDRENESDVWYATTTDATGKTSTKTLNEKGKQVAAKQNTLSGGVINLNASNKKLLIEQSGIPRKLLSGNAAKYDMASGALYDKKGNVISQITSGYDSALGKTLWYEWTTKKNGDQVVQAYDENGNRVGKSQRIKAEKEEKKQSANQSNSDSGNSNSNNNSNRSNSSSNNSGSSGGGGSGGGGGGGGFSLAGLNISGGMVGVAGAGSTPTQPFGTLKTIESLCGLDTQTFTLDAEKDIKFLSIAVPCFEKLMGIVAKTSVEGFSSYMANAVAVALSLYLIFFGIKVSTGLTNEQRVKGETIIHALKIAFVAWLVFQSGIMDMYGLTLQFLNGFITLVLRPVQLGDCNIASSNTEQVWIAMDCLFGKFIGWNEENANGKTEGVPLLFGFVTSSLSSGFGGALIAGTILMTVWALIMAFFRTAFAYVLAILVIVLLFVIAPITIPMMLFTPTKTFFDQWWKMIVSALLQPVVLFAFMSFMLAIMYEIIVGDNGILSEVYKNSEGEYQNILQRTQGDQNYITSGYNMKMEDAEENLEALNLSVISMLVVAYLMMTFAKFVSSMGHELSGTPLAPNLGKSTDSGGFSPAWIK